MINVGINGFGRIGKYLARLLLKEEGINICAINDLAPVAAQAHLFKYDSIHGKFNGEVSVEKDAL
ncbi:MAG TPA: type I glyceraldehyde-3-phosphate dehydrogenase, partial [Flavobacteriales bacterium]|nr:type I glyceraldehyde-3-phosphate dehydrogenase [Flavobacteriales bacterium]